MAVNVGELYAELRLDADQFTQGLQAGQQGLGSLSDAARRAAQAAQSSSDEQVRAYGRMRQAADQAARAVEQAHDRAGEAAERVRLAEERLEQARRDGGDVAQAQQRLVAAQRDQQRAAEQTTAAVERLEAANRRASRSAQDIDFERVEREARQAAQATQQVDVPSGVAGRVRDIGSALGDLSGRVSGSSGSGAASNFVSSFSDGIGNLASKTGPIAGSLLGVAALGLAAGAALAAAIEDGMSAEKNRDLFQAQTGTTTAQARKFGLAAGEAYADAYGESVEANLDTAKAALANGLLDPGATQQDAEKMISSLDGVATILGEDIPQVARAAGNAVKSGFAADTQDALDLLVKGSQMGLNASEDLLDTIIEYSVQFEKVGLTGAQAFGLMNQAVQAGARDTDTAADAIKEFAIKSIDGSKAAADAYQALGFNAEDMTAKIAQGGAEGAEGMAELLTRIRETEDPVVRNAVAVGLFGTKAEDLGNAMSALDLSTAVQSMNDYEGAASRAIAVMNGNAATSVEGAMRSISTIADSMKAALAEAFGPYIQEWADKVSNNRAGVVQFFLDVGNGAFEGARAILEFVSGGMRGLAEFADASTDMSVTFLRGLADMTSGMSAMGGLLGTLIPGLGPMLGGIGDMSDKLNNLADAAEAGGNGVADGLRTGADFIEGTLVPGLDTVQNRFNEFGEGVKNSAGFNDALAKVDGTISKIGVGIDGAALKLDGFTGAIDRNNAAQVAMDNQLRGLVGAMQEQTRAGLEAGATVEQLTGNYHAQRDALLSQLMATGMSNQAALDYINSLGLVPDLVETQINQPGMPEAHYATDVLHEKVIGVPTSKEIHTTALTKDAIDTLTALGIRVEELPDGTFRVFADTEEGETHLQNFLNRERNATVTLKFRQDQVSYWQAMGAANPSQVQGPTPVARADGAIQLERYADGGGMLPKDAIIQAPRPRLVQWAEPETEGEAFIPLASSKRPRSLAILGEVARRFGMSLVDEGHARVREDIGRMFDPLTGWANLLAGDYDGRLAHSGVQEDDRIVAAVLGARSLLVDGDYTGNLLDAFGWQEDSPEVDALLGLQERDPEAVRRGLSAMAGRHVRGEFDRVFNGDPKSLTDADDPTGWCALLGGDYNGKLARFGIHEDHPLVAAVLGSRSFLVDGDYTANLHAGLGLHEDSAPVDIAFGVRNMLANGDYDGSLAKYGIQEDNPLTDVLLGAHKALYGQSFANGGVVEGLTALAAEKAPALQVTSSYRDTSDHHGSGKAVDFSNGSGNTDEMLAWANYLADNYQDQLLELIYDDPRFDRNIKNGKIVPRDYYAGAGDHTNHVHAAMSVPPQSVAVDERPKAIGADKLTSKQRNVDAVIAEGKRRGMSDQAIRSAVATMLAESNGENLANEADPESLKYQHDGLGSDHDSSGVFQQRNNSAWGTAEDRMDPTRAAGMFYDQYAKVDGDSMSPEAAAQAVQRSAFSDGSNYAAKLDEADQLIAESGQRGSLDSSSGFPTDSKTDSFATGGVQDVRVTNWPSSLLDPAPLPGTDQATKPDERKGHGFALAYYRDGGMAEDHSAQIAPAGSWRVWAEEETGGEAYIPLAPSKRARSTSILRQVAHRFGMQLMADGSFMAPNDPAFDPGGSKHHDTVQAWLGTDAGGTASLSTIDQANPADVAAQNAYRAGVGIFGGAMALVDLIQGLMGGGVIGTGIDIAEGIRTAIEDKVKEQAGPGGAKPLGNPDPAADATRVGAQFYGPVTITDPEGFIKDQLRAARNQLGV
ncbi:phage tail tape measure protein [Rhodococcus ruber]|uniref:phage tail tape measure protein n=1 Tax=Rhodococcus ruber TaxID=1830 RepID=UPI003783BD06